MKEIKEINLKHTVKIEISLKELDVIRICLATADGNNIKSYLDNAGIEFESSEKYELMKDCRRILERYGVLEKRNDDEI